MSLSLLAQDQPVQRYVKARHVMHT